MALRLQALHAEVTLLLSEQPVVLGRSRELSVSSTSVSRHACSCFRDGKAAAKIVAAKRIYVRQKGSADAFAVTKDDTLQVKAAAVSFHNLLACTESICSLTVVCCSIELE